MPGIQMNPLDEKAVKQKMAKNHNLRSVFGYRTEHQGKSCLLASRLKDKVLGSTFRLGKGIANGL